MTTTIEAGARAKSTVTDEMVKAALHQVIHADEFSSVEEQIRAALEAAIASGELVPASAGAVERERCARKCEAVMPNESVMVNGTPYVRYHDLKKEIKRRADEIRALEPASGEYVLVPRSILTDTQEALEQTDDWHVVDSENWTLYHQIDVLLHPEQAGFATAATSNGSGSK